MRYEDWDVLLFRRGCKVPIKEFKTNCHVVHDAEFAHGHGSFGLPTMTCFIPSLPPKTPFYISLHSWNTPEISQFAKTYSKHHDLVRFEARILIDGRLLASQSLSPAGPWPQELSQSFGAITIPLPTSDSANPKLMISQDFTRNGDLEFLRFPSFNKELLHQNYWSPADELGRIKIIISEGFPRDSMTVPMERIKNVMAFSFQHAPMEILEESGIAWPNPTMWRRGPFNPTIPGQEQQSDNNSCSHLHSPRHRSDYNQSSSFSLPSTTSFHQEASMVDSMPHTQSFLQRSSAGTNSSFKSDATTDLNNSDLMSSFDWSNIAGSSMNYTQDAIRGSLNPMSDMVSAPSNGLDANSSMSDFGIGQYQPIANMHPTGTSGPIFDDVDTHHGTLKVPTNTPTTGVGQSFNADDIGVAVDQVKAPGSGTPCNNSMGNTNDMFYPNANIPADLANTLTHSLLNQPHPLPVGTSAAAMPAPEVRSRKENRTSTGTPLGNPASYEHGEIRKVSQSLFSNLSKKNRDGSGTSSPPGQGHRSGIFSRRSTSGGDFGSDLTNMAMMGGASEARKGDSDTTGSDSRIVSTGSDKGNKRTRNFTPVSSKVIDDADQPRRSSPRARLGLDLEAN